MSVIPPRAGSALPIAVAALLATAMLAACSGSDGTPEPAASTNRASGTPSPSGTSPGLESYTDAGDGCAQAISAISYADDVLRPLGQEPYQEFDDVVRSRLAAVAGTLSLEGKDWPDEPVHQQAKIVQPLAQAAAARLTDQSATAKAKRINVLLRYRIEAATLVLVCRDAIPPTPSPTPSS
jgi:hypothetical protein